MTDSDKIDKLVIDVATLIAKLDDMKDDINTFKGFESRLVILEEFHKGFKTKVNTIMSGILVSIGTAIWNIIKVFS